MTLAPAIAAINEYMRLDLINTAKRKGEYLGGKAKRNQREAQVSWGHPRARALFWAVELVENRKTKTPLYESADKLADRPSLLDRISSDVTSQGVYAVNWPSHFVIAPPLIITEEEIDRGVEALDKSLEIADVEAS